MTTALVRIMMRQPSPDQDIHQKTRQQMGWFFCPNWRFCRGSMRWRGLPGALPS